MQQNVISITNSVFNHEKIASTAATEHTSSGESPTGKIYGEFTKEKRQNLYKDINGI